MSGGCAAGESVIPVTGVKRDRRQPMRYKISPQSNSHKFEPVTLSEVRLVPDDFIVCEPSNAAAASALQDLASVQVPLFAGVISLLVGDALQDRFAVFARQLVDRDKRVLAAER